MEKINAYLIKYQKRYILVKFAIFMTKVVGITIFLLLCGLGGHSDNGGELGLWFWVLFAAGILSLVILDGVNKKLHRVKKYIVRRYKRGLAAKEMKAVEIEAMRIANAAQSE